MFRDLPIDLTELEPVRPEYGCPGTSLHVDSFIDDEEFHEFEPRFKSAKTRCQQGTGLNLEKLNTVLSGTNDISAAAQIFKIRSQSI